MRLAALGKPPRIVPELNKSAWAELSRTAGNLNQIARAIADGRLPSTDAPKAGKVVMEVRAELETVRRNLIGLEVPRDEGEG